MEEENSKIYDKLLKKDIYNIVAFTNSELVGDNKIELDFFKEEVVVDLNEKKVFYSREDNTGRQKNEEIVDKYSSSLILHYLLNADGTPIDGTWVSYRELPGGLFYWRTIPGVLEQLKKKYGSDGNVFLDKSIRIGGVKYSKFKYASIIYPFRMLPVLMILDERSEEFEADARVLFDRSASHYMETYGMKLLVILIVKKLCR